MEKQLIKLFYKAEDSFFSNVSSDTIIFNEYAKSYITGVPAEGLNILSCPKISDDFSIIVTKAINKYSQLDLPWILVTKAENCNEQNYQILADLGLNEIDESTAMFINLDGNIETSITDLQFIEDGSNLNVWRIPLTEAFEANNEIMDSYVKAHQRFKANEGKMFHYVGLLDGVSIVSCTISIFDNIARIDDVGTLPEYQNKGYATAIIKHGLSKAKEEGAAFCFLEASKQGLGIYKKIGFEEIFINKVFKLGS